MKFNKLFRGKKFNLVINTTTFYREHWRDWMFHYWNVHPTRWNYMLREFGFRLCGIMFNWFKYD